MGVVDQTYVNTTGDNSVAVGRKVSLHAEELEKVFSLVSRLGNHVWEALREKRAQKT